jgi:hypothetical protein
MRINAVSKTALVVSALIFSTVIGNAQSVPGAREPSAGAAPSAAPPPAASSPATGASPSAPVGAAASPTTNTAPGSTAGAPPPAVKSDVSKPAAAEKAGTAPTTAQPGAPGAATQTTSTPAAPNSGSTAAPAKPAAASAPVNVTSEQKTVIRQTIINNNNAPRVSSLNFSIGVGVAVPTTVHFAPIPPTILSLNPSWQAYHYFVYQEDLVIVDPVTRQIIAVIRV